MYMYTCKHTVLDSIVQCPMEQSDIHIPQYRVEHYLCRMYHSPSVPTEWPGMGIEQSTASAFCGNNSTERGGGGERSREREREREREDSPHQEILVSCSRQLPWLVFSAFIQSWNVNRL